MRQAIEDAIGVLKAKKREALAEAGRLDSQIEQLEGKLKAHGTQEQETVETKDVGCPG